ncbi:hypothetical protein HPE56_07310 [Maribacter sp. ANRC-HE7]|uniref:Glutamine cyclotransferase n=1 Tax=Maribacter aquimaris TaxID=2737171 RepID=A0ABR7UZ82_9FLAO|nr:hypothetical protein [Maribacter aquimaris]MBD0777596.1 hypothetical protein [Maribacter aquimaris]
MKTIENHHILKTCFIFFTLTVLLQSCNNDDSPTQKGTDKEMGILLRYPDSLVETIFRKQGSLAPIEIDWNGEKGTLSISSTTTILESNNIQFEEDTGIIFWSRLLPLGEFDLTITAKNSKDAVDTNILFSNRFDRGYFSGGFEAGNPTEIDPTTIPVEYGLTLHEDHTVSMINYTDPAFIASGIWETLEGPNIAIEYTSNGETTYMKGQLYHNGELPNLPVLEGVYGAGKDASGEIIAPEGRFLFKWD